MRLSQLGWVLAAAIVGVEIGGGFQPTTKKTGFIDMQAVYSDSNLKKKNDDKLRAAAQSRQAAFDFMGLNPEFTTAQLARYKELSIKDPLTPAESSEIAKLKAAAQAATNEFDDLRKKPNPTAQDLKTLNDLGALNESNKLAQEAWGREFTAQLQTMESDLNSEALDAIRQAIARVAKPQAYSLVFRENVAVYGSNNLAPEVKKIVDKNAK
ncbi:MAG: OmpH family outer membrane protein [Fimbriimonadaceae bacterium]